MIKTNYLKKLLEAFPNGHLSDPFMNASYLFDKNKNMIGHLDYSHEEFYLNQDYKFLKEAKHVLNKNNISYALKEYNEAELIYT